MRSKWVAVGGYQDVKDATDWMAPLTEGRQGYSGVGINNAKDVKLFGNKVRARYSHDQAFFVAMDAGTTFKLAGGGDNHVCRGKLDKKLNAYVSTGSAKDCSSWFTTATNLAPPTPSPRTSNPTSPTPAPPSTCVQCTDVATAWMIKTGKACATWPNGLTKNCNGNQAWASEKTCRLSCYKEGRGYDGDTCCGSPTPPTPSPPTCKQCTDNRPNNERPCATQNNLDKRCRNSNTWVRQTFCQLTCYSAGFGYDGDNCCSGGGGGEGPTGLNQMQHIAGPNSQLLDEKELTFSDDQDDNATGHAAPEVEDEPHEISAASSRSCVWLNSLLLRGPSCCLACVVAFACVLLA